MSVKVIDTIKPKNDGGFPVVEAVDVSVDSTRRLPDALNEKADVSALQITNAAVNTKADAQAVNDSLTGLQAQIDEILESAEDGSALSELDKNGKVTVKVLKAAIDTIQGKIQSEEIDALTAMQAAMPLKGKELKASASETIPTLLILKIRLMLSVM